METVIVFTSNSYFGNFTESTIYREYPVGNEKEKKLMIAYDGDRSENYGENQISKIANGITGGVVYVLHHTHPKKRHRNELKETLENKGCNDITFYSSDHNEEVYKRAQKVPSDCNNTNQLEEHYNYIKAVILGNPPDLKLEASIHLWKSLTLLGVKIRKKPTLEKDYNIEAKKILKSKKAQALDSEDLPPFEQWVNYNSDMKVLYKKLFPQN